MDLPVQHGLSIVDYVILSVVLALSSCIGIYYGCTGDKQSTTKEYLLANRKMHFLPVAASMMASTASAIATIGTGAEVYMYTSIVWWLGIGFIIVNLTVAHLYLPLFYDLGITSIYEYMELRFSRPVRLLSTAIYLFYKVLYLALVIYAPAMALNAATGLSIWTSTLTVGSVCTFYTALGGMKAVIWTDVMQMVLMYVGVLSVIIKGSVMLGGLGNVWKIADEGGRIVYADFDIDPRTRNTVWSLTIGFAFNYLSPAGASQQIAQRFNSCSSAKEGIKAMYCNAVFLLLMISCATLAGVVVFAVYAYCDPLRKGFISKPDQLLPYFIVENLGNIPGLPGLFIASTFSAALSTLSSGLNSMAAVIHEDFIKPWRCCLNISDKTSTIILKVLSTLLGGLAILFVFVVSQFGTIIQVAGSLAGVLLGPVFGVFTLGIFFPCANSLGALFGLMSGIGMGATLSVGSFIYKTRQAPLPTSIDGCPVFNSTDTNITSGVGANYTFLELTTMTPMNDTVPPFESPSEGPEWFIQFVSMSFLWYGLVEIITVVIIGILVSLLTGYRKPRDVDAGLLSPLYRKCRCCLPECCCPPLYEKAEKSENEIPTNIMRVYGDNSDTAVPAADESEQSSPSSERKQEQLSTSDDESDSFKKQQINATSDAIELENLEKWEAI
ncbi:sodium-coupled monocarboxylate transporter 2-like [Ptychodera flava]|uniref:sodium-coupled monocarboxylate transporter 2-like n=1 Tax=Ptychodera flava TaxID=63121 RepID=UPI003969D536